MANDIPTHALRTEMIFLIEHCWDIITRVKKTCLKSVAIAVKYLDGVPTMLAVEKVISVQF